ncbi:MAG TPA: hypothetical protein VKT72_08520 [Candidatus Baltobacteraceae bacterium]|nr:hypothetical protein [Candidatus Baltobacteraceae bacterium]
MPSTQPQTARTAGTKVGIHIRMYRVGFGDFFLLSFPAPSGPPLYVLVDCGVHAVDLNSLDDAVADMAKLTSGQLALVIMTHRHADHISGFGRCAKAFAGFNVERVWMSWFEDPKNAAAASYQSTLTAVATNLQAAFALRADAPDSDYVRMVQNATGELSAAGGPTGNQAALNVLRGGFKNRPPIDYYQAGDTATLPDSLVQAGVTAKILGPPIDPDLVAEMDGKGHQYLSTNSDDGAAPKRFSQVFNSSKAAYPQEAFELYTPDEISKNIAAAQPDLAIAKATQVDNTINNQSLVILFGLQGKTLLLAGDAQWGNWQNFLFGGALGTAGHNGLTDEAKQILGNIDVYKVGHHGSTNATPIDAVNAMRADAIAMCSTQPGAYGKPENNSEVPRIPLIAALNKKTENQLARSDSVMVPGADTPQIQQFEKNNPPGPLPPVFQAGSSGAAGQLYVELEI